MVRKNTTPSCPVNSSPSTSTRTLGFQASGFHTGSVSPKIGSCVPMAMASTAYSGVRKSRISQITPGRANEGQSQRCSPTAPSSAAPLRLRASGPLLDPGPGLEPAVLLLRRLLLGYLTNLEVFLLDDRRGEVLGDQTLVHEGLRRERLLGRLVAEPAEVLQRHPLVEHVVDKHVGEDGMLGVPEHRQVVVGYHAAHFVLRSFRGPHVAQHRSVPALGHVLGGQDRIARPGLDQAKVALW